MVRREESIEDDGGCADDIDVLLVLGLLYASRVRELRRKLRTPYCEFAVYIRVR